MKTGYQTTFIVLIVFLTYSRICAQYPWYKAVTTKTNMISLCNISVDFPVCKTVSAEVGARFMGQSKFIPEGKGYRINIKYNFAVGTKRNGYPFIFAGINRLKAWYIYNDVKYWTESQLDVIRIPLGMGLKYRRASFWIAAEIPAKTYKNVTQVHNCFSCGVNGEETWRKYDYISAGVALTLINVKMPFRETKVYKWPGPDKK